MCSWLRFGFHTNSLLVVLFTGYIWLCRNEAYIYVKWAAYRRTCEGCDAVLSNQYSLIYIFLFILLFHNCLFIVSYLPCNYCLSLLLEEINDLIDWLILYDAFVERFGPGLELFIFPMHSRCMTVHRPQSLDREEHCTLNTVHITYYTSHSPQTHHTDTSHIGFRLNRAALQYARW